MSKKSSELDELYKATLKSVAAYSPDSRMSASLRAEHRVELMRVEQLMTQCRDELQAAEPQNFAEIATMNALLDSIRHKIELLQPLH